MDLRQLRYFVAVAEEQHVTRAAKRLGIQQPPLSLTIQALEAEVGGKLFVRGPRGMEVTAAGAVLLEEARVILGSVERAGAMTRRAMGGQVGRLSVGFTTSAMMHPLVPQIIKSFRSQTPHVALDVQEGNAAELTERVNSGEIAVGFLRLPVAHPTGVVFQRLLDEALVAVLPIGHDLLRGRDLEHPKPIRLRELAGEPFILVRRPNAPGMYANLLHACREAGFDPLVAAEVGYMLTNINLVAAGMGVSLVPEAMREVNLRHLVYLPVQPAAGLSAPLTMVYLERRRSPILEQFLILARAMAEDWDARAAD